VKCHADAGAPNAKTVADQFVETLAAAGVKRVTALSAISLNALPILFAAGQDRMVACPARGSRCLCRGRQAHLTGEIAVCAGSCGPATFT